MSLFHALPGGELPAVLADLREVARREAFAVLVTGVRSLGRGTALVVGSPALLAVRAELARRWSPWLTRQDAQPFSAHVTVQNTVAPAAAKALVAQLRAGFAPWALTATGVHLWCSLDGPWEHVATTGFAPA